MDEALAHGRQMAAWHIRRAERTLAHMREMYLKPHRAPLLHTQREQRERILRRLMVWRDGLDKLEQKARAEFAAHPDKSG